MRRFLAGAFLLAAAWDPVTSKNADVEDGNGRYAAQSFKEAEARYRQAGKRLGSDPALHFDLGTALQAQGNLEAAEPELRLALDATEPALRASAHYNLGNTLFATGRYDEAIDEYKKSLKVDPYREEARHNLELALVRKQEPPPEPPPPPEAPPAAPEETGPAARARGLGPAVDLGEQAMKDNLTRLEEASREHRAAKARERAAELRLKIVKDW